MLPPNRAQRHRLGEVGLGLLVLAAFGGYFGAQIERNGGIGGLAQERDGPVEMRLRCCGVARLQQHGGKINARRREGRIARDCTLEFRPRGFRIAEGFVCFTEGIVRFG